VISRCPEWRVAWLPLLMVLLVVGCSTPGPRLPKPAPTAIPEPSMTAADVVGEEAPDVESAFQVEVLNVADEARYLADGDCTALNALMREDPQVFQRLRDLGEILMRVSRGDDALKADATRILAEDMQEALSEMDLSLGFCGIPPTRKP
jgi:hypothetical protein